MTGIKKYLFCLHLATVSFIIFLSGNSSAQQWARTYGAEGSDFAHSIQQTSDGGYIVSGWTVLGTADEDFWVLKLNSDGTVIWQKKYGGDGNEQAKSVQQTTDGGYIAAGWAPSDLEDDNFWVVKIKSDLSEGDIQLQRVYGGSGNEQANSIQQTTDGGYIVAGWTDSSGAGGEDFWLLKLNSDLTVGLQKTYGGAGHDRATFVQQTTDGGYVVAGSTFSSGAGDSDVWVLKLNSALTAGLQKTYGGASSDIANSIQQTSDGGYIFAGWTRSAGSGNRDFWIVKLDSSLGVQWQKAFGGTGDDVANSIQQTSDGGYVTAGYSTSFGPGDEDILILKLNSSGAIQWQKIFSASGNERANGIQQSSDGGYVVAGGTSSSGAGSNDLLVLKLNSEGAITNCSSISSVSVTSSDSAVSGTDTAVTGADTSITPAAGGGTADAITLSQSEVCFFSISVNPASHNFGNVAIGESSTSGFTVSNSTSASFFISGITISGGSSGDFSIQNDQCSGTSIGTSLPSDSCTVEVVFSPSAEGSKSASLNIDLQTTTDPSPISLSGTAVAASDSSGTSGCFIATSAYGSYLDPHVVILRNFRDRHLLTNAPGRIFVDLYYMYSPAVAEYIRGHENMKKAVRILLAPVVFAIEYPSLLLLAPAVLLCVRFIPRRKR
ncbi:MAG: choice-of-anchor D domain-containing protein [Nitrospiraceae bacterium]|nr:MAG: choice-of-anchor D domain-containing protein [Nitrospiraceae bacterium]